MALHTRFPAGMTLFWFYANKFSNLNQLCILNLP